MATVSQAWLNSLPSGVSVLSPKELSEYVGIITPADKTVDLHDRAGQIAYRFKHVGRTLILTREPSGEPLGAFSDLESAVRFLTDDQWLPGHNWAAIVIGNSLHKPGFFFDIETGNTGAKRLQCTVDLSNPPYNWHPSQFELIGAKSTPGSVLDEDRVIPWL